MVDQAAHPVNEPAQATAERMVRNHGSRKRARDWAVLHAQSYELLEPGYAYWMAVVEAIDRMGP